MDSKSSSRRNGAVAGFICFSLMAAVLVVFGQTLGFGFLNYDDNLYLNQTVSKGVALDGLRWAFVYGEIGHWHPLTWISHMVDCQLYGTNPWGHHLTNVLLHAGSVVMLFLVLWRMTGGLWQSAFVAAIFAIHPLRAESVAWISERKDVLSAFFFMLTLASYSNYVCRPQSWGRYLATLLVFAFGLLAKNMLVTLPFVLLLLDYWPLKRARLEEGNPALSRLLVEKVPFLALSIGSCVATLLTPEAESLAKGPPVLERGANAAISCVIYLWQMINPAGLGAPYPWSPDSQLGWEAGFALVFLAGISGVAWWLRSRAPYLLVGWFWYLGMLVPVLGIVQISYYAHADRYTYLPQVGIYLLVTWSLADISFSWRHRRWILGTAASTTIFVLAIMAHKQVSYWHDSETWWRHTLANTDSNAVACANLGQVWALQGKTDAAIEEYRQALRLNPSYETAHQNLGLALASQGKTAEAIDQYRQAIRLRPDYSEAWVSLAGALASQGETTEAMDCDERALQIHADYPEALNNLGNLLARRGKFGDAIKRYRRAIASMPGYADAYVNLGSALSAIGHTDEAIDAYRRAIELDMRSAAAQFDLGNALASEGKSADALKAYTQATRIKPDFVQAYVGAANLLASIAEPDSAGEQYLKAIEIDPSYLPAHFQFGEFLVSRSRPLEAISHLEQASQLAGGQNPAILDCLAGAYAAAGQPTEARETAQRAFDLATTSGDTALVNIIREHLDSLR